MTTETNDWTTREKVLVGIASEAARIRELLMKDNGGQEPSPELVASLLTSSNIYMQSLAIDNLTEAMDRIEDALSALVVPAVVKKQPCH